MGNIRVSYSKNASGSAEVLEENNFYPFGLKHEGYNAQTGNLSYNYQYNGKEIQKETGWSDYGARMYMSDIGRWGVIDPLSETSRRFTPYNYAYNNPIRFIDPDGNAPYNPRDVYGEHSAFNGDFDPNTSLSSYNGMARSHGYGMYFESNPGAGYAWGTNTNDSNDKYSLLNDLRSMWEARGIYTSISPNGYLTYWTGGAAGNANTSQEMVANMFKITENLAHTSPIPEIKRPSSIFNPGQQNFDWGHIGNTMTAGGIVYYALEKSIYSKYHWVDAKGIVKSTKLLEKGANGKFVRGVQGLRNGYAAAGKATL